MAVVKYDIDEFPAGLRLFQDTVNRMLNQNSARPWVPAVDIFETENEWVLKADLPEQLIKDMKAAAAQGWGTVTPVLAPLPGMPY